MVRFLLGGRLADTLALLKDGYLFLPRRRERGAGVVEVRFLGERVACVGGPEAAAVFYDESKFTRDGALPRFVQKTLTGEGGVQTLDGAAHQVRKDIFMSLMTPAGIDRLGSLFEQAWRDALPRWERSSEIVLFTEATELLCRAVCQWSGVPLRDDEVSTRAHDLISMVDGFGTAGMRHLTARQARKRSEAWAMSLVQAVRTGTLTPGAGTALEAFAIHRDFNGEQLPVKTAAVDLLNVLRPVVAIAYFIAFTGHALRRHPEWRSRLARADDEATEWFVHEVRRYYPLTPFLGARARHAFTWAGYEFEPGQLILLNVYGTHHDDRVWHDASTFDPDRFRERAPAEFDLIPQGGGDHHRDHRCAGEWVTIAIMRSAACLLASMEYTMPRQDLRISLRTIPTKPRSGVVVSGIIASPDAGNRSATAATRRSDTHAS